MSRYAYVVKSMGICSERLFNLPPLGAFRRKEVKHDRSEKSVSTLCFKNYRTVKSSVENTIRIFGRFEERGEVGVKNEEENVIENFLGHF